MKTSKLLTLIKKKTPEWFVNVGTIENPELVNLKQLMIIKLIKLSCMEAGNGVD